MSDTQKQLPVSGKSVTVGCKLPNGLIMELGTRGKDDYRQVRLRGAQSSRIAGGFGLTDVSEDFMQAWMKKNKDLTFVRKGLVFVQADGVFAEGHAKDHRDLRSGLERLDPKKAPKGVEVDKDHLKRAAADLEEFHQSQLGG